MFYQTSHLSFPFPCSNPFSFSLSSSSNSSPFQVEKEMECIVKGGFEPKQTHQQQVVCFEDFRTSTTSNNNNNNVTLSTISSVVGEDFFVDQLLNLNNVEDCEEDYGQQQVDHHHNNNTSTSVTLVARKEQENVNNQSPMFKKLSPLDSVLSVPAEEADLEWLSQFVEESFSQFSTPYPPGYVKPKPNPEFLPDGPFFTPPNLSKSRRSKRARTGGRVWSAALSDPSSPGSPSSPPKKYKKKYTAPSGGVGGPARRCSHCGVQRTPQWRAGPMGAKTLCNACGVRFKSGRLLPEYRPAGSPTFSSELHSNSHRKVLEMRRKKEMVSDQPESGHSTRLLSSFG